MSVKVASSKMPPPAPPKPKTNFESRTDITAKSNATATAQPSNSAARPFPGGLKALKKWRPFASIPPFSPLRDIKGKPDLGSLASIDISTEPPTVFAERGILSKNQLPISQWPMYTSYLAAAVGSRPKKSISATIDEAPRQAKHEDILDYVYDWASWAAEIPDEARRIEVLGWVMKTLEQVLKHAIERTGMVLGPNDVEGTTSGTKKTLEGEVKIQVIISSSVKETAGKKLAVQKTKIKFAKDKQDESGAAAALVPSEPNPELLQSIELAAKASLTKAKRAAIEIDHSDEADGLQRHVKRQKTEDEEQQGVEGVNSTVANNQQEGSAAGNTERLSYDSTLSMSAEEEEKRAHYRQQIFQPRLNHILKRARKVQTRGRCRKWDTVKARLTDARVSVKFRNMMLRDFYLGYDAWDGDANIDPNEALAHFAQHCFGGASEKEAAGMTDIVKAGAGELVVDEHADTEAATLLSAIENLPAFDADTPIPDAFIPAQPPTQPTQPSIATPQQPGLGPQQTPKKLIITLRTFPSFDPNDYSLYSQYQHENFMFSFTTSSTTKERVAISERLIAQIDAELNVAIDDDIDESGTLSPRRQLIRNERGKVVVTGNFVDLNSDYMVMNGMADPKKPWLWKERMLSVDWRYFPSACAGHSKEAGEQLGVKVEE